MPRGLGLVIYGVEGIGKSSLSYQAPTPSRVISIRQTDYQDLNDIGRIPVGCEEACVETFPQLITEMGQSTDVKTIVIENLSSVAEIVKEDILRTIYQAYDNPEQAFGSFSEGWRIHAPDYMNKLCNMGTILRNKGVNVIFIGHAKIEKAKTIISTDYQSAVLDLESWPRSVVTKWAQAVLFMTMDFKVRITKNWKGTPTEAKAVDSLDEQVDRVMYTDKHPSHSAKNRLDLPSYIPMGSSPEEAWANFVEKLPAKIKENL